MIRYDLCKNNNNNNNKYSIYGVGKKNKVFTNLFELRVPNMYICTRFVCLRAQLTLLVRSERVYTGRTFGLNDENFCHFRMTRTSATFRNI